jgi:hypothetical protein
MNNNSPHGIHKDGDFSSYGDIENFASSKARNEKKDFGINSKKYHFHATVQELEDGIYEQFKEQNRNFNKGREVMISSVSDAMYRKLYTSMIYPIMLNTFFLISVYLFVPLILSINIFTNYFTYLALFLGLFFILNIYFDAYVVYRIRKYVIEQVTKKYYLIIKNSWKSFEFVLIFISTFFFCFSIYYTFYTTIPQIDLQNKYIIKFISYFDLSRLIEINIYFVPINLSLYMLFIKIIDKKAEIIQKTAIIESRKNSEHNADVAEALLNGSYLDIDIKNI